MPGGAGALLEILIDLRQGGGAIDAGFAAAQQIEIGAVQHQEGGHAVVLVLSWEWPGLCRKRCRLSSCRQ
ncbi:hypothetical protein D3C78_1823700 [compost metagenome]